MPDSCIRVLLISQDAADVERLRGAGNEAGARFHINHIEYLQALRAIDGASVADIAVIDLSKRQHGITQLIANLEAQSGGIPILAISRQNEANILDLIPAGITDYIKLTGDNWGDVCLAIGIAVARRRHDKAKGKFAGSFDSQGGISTPNTPDVDVNHMSRVGLAGQLAAGLAHELTQPVTAILNCATVALEQTQRDRISRDDLKQAVGEIMAASRRAAEIIKRMRAFVRKQPPRSRRIAINSLVEGVASLLEFRLREEGVIPDFQLSDRLPLAMADPVQIQQVIVNLMLNALDAMESIAPEQRVLKVATTAQDSGRKIFVSICDNGCGMSEDGMARLFEAFYSTKPNGMGVGLNISRSIIESHGGRLTASCNASGGMTFGFTIPAALDASS